MTKRMYFPDSQCRINGCTKTPKRRWLCTRHYDALCHNGDAEKTYFLIHATREERLRHRGWTVTASGCWEVKGAGDRRGYRVFRVEKRRIKAHRLAYETWVGPIPTGKLVRHKCDNPPCINPGHLETGTGRDNSRDRVERGRSVIYKGVQLPHTKLTEQDVRDIRVEYSNGVLTQKMLADVYGVSRSNIGLIVTRQNWRWLK